MSHSRDSQERALESPTPPPLGGWDIPGQEQTGPRGSSAIKFRMWPQAQAWSCGDRRPLPVLTAQPHGGLCRLQVALSQAEDQVPRGLGEMDCIPGDPPSPLYASLGEMIRGGGSWGTGTESHTNHPKALWPPEPRLLLPKLGTEMDQAATPHALADKTPTQTVTLKTLSRSPQQHAKPSAGTLWLAISSVPHNNPARWEFRSLGTDKEAG